MAVDTALRRKGLLTAAATFSDLRDIYDQHESSWNGLVPCFDATTQSINPETAGCFVVYNTDGEPVSTIAVRVWDIAGSTVRQEIESLRLFYGDGAEVWRRRAEITLTAPIAEHLTGTVMYCGAFWVRPDYRGLGLGSLLPALGSYYAMSRWPIDYKISIGAKAFHAPELQELYQFESYDPEFKMIVDGDLYYKGGLLWSRASYVLDRLSVCVRAAVEQLERPQLQHREQPAIT